MLWRGRESLKPCLLQCDDEPLSFKKMHEFSTTDGFMEIADSLADMITVVANEPSVGLFYIQQHVSNAVPNLVNLKSKLVEKSHKTTLHTEDLEDSIAMARSMKECGFPIAEEMVKDISRSLAVMSARREKKGLMMNMRSSSFRLGRTTSWVGHKQDVERSGYFSDVFGSGREKPSSIKWPPPQLEPRELKPVGDASSSSTVVDADSDDLPVSSHIADGGHDDIHPILSSSKSYEELSSEARLEKWLEGTDNCNVD